MAAQKRLLEGRLSDRDALVAHLASKVIRIPDLEPMFEDWPGLRDVDQGPTGHLSTLRAVVSRRLKSLYSRGAARSLKQLIDADFAFFTVLWWPHAPLATQKILAYLVIWLFTWDDEIDDPEGSVADDWEGAQLYRNETETFVKSCLGLCDDIPGSPSKQRPIVQSFSDIGLAFCEAYNLEQRNRFFAEITRFMRMSEKEQQLRLLNVAPTLDQYWEYRMGTSAVYIGVAAAEFASHSTSVSRLPARMMDSSTMWTIWKETNIIISITNDLLSLRKEINKGAIESLVPLTCATGLGVDDAVADVILQLSESKVRFDDAAARLRKEYLGETQNIQDQVDCFIDVCRTDCTGNLLWSLETARYGMQEAKNSGRVVTSVAVAGAGADCGHSFRVADS